MIYILMPKGMEFKQISNNGELKDYLVDPNQMKPTILLQDLVKDALRKGSRKEQGSSAKRRNYEIKVGELIIYLNRPPANSDVYLEYNPNRNGARPTTEPARLITGTEAQRPNPATKTSYGSFWFEHANLSQEQRDEIQAKRIEQKHNRRHDGDCPLPT